MLKVAKKKPKRKNADKIAIISPRATKTLDASQVANNYTRCLPTHVLFKKMGKLRK